MSDLVLTLKDILNHRLHVQAGMQKVIQDLERRSLVHDESKFRKDEIEGFARINHISREHPYGSPEYRASLKAEKPTIDLHYSRNSHHAEHFLDHEGEMSLLDLIEMTVDWHAAWTVYEMERAPEHRCSWSDNLAKNYQRFVKGKLITEEQWWVVQEVAKLLE